MKTVDFSELLQPVTWNLLRQWRYVSIEGQGQFLTLAQGHVHLKMKTGFSQKWLAILNQILFCAYTWPKYQVSVSQDHWSSGLKANLVNSKRGIFTRGFTLVKIQLSVFIRWNKNQSYIEKIKYPQFRFVQIVIIYFNIISTFFKFIYLFFEPSKLRGEKLWWCMCNKEGHQSAWA